MPWDAIKELKDEEKYLLIVTSQNMNRMLTLSLNFFLKVLKSSK